MVEGVLDMMGGNDETVWRIHQRLGVVEVGWYTDYREEEYLTAKIFGTEEEAEFWRKEFWDAYWRLSGALSDSTRFRKCDD
jgi:hypothetical protein